MVQKPADLHEGNRAVPLLRVFFEGHDPTQRMRQGNDVGTQYRSSVFTTSAEHAETAHRVADRFGESQRLAC